MRCYGKPGLASYEKQGVVRIIDVELSVVKRFSDKIKPLKVDIHDGERATLAYLFQSSEPWLICAADSAVFRVLGLLGKADQGISLQEILQKIGLSPAQKLEWEYTKKFREKFTRMGQVDFAQR